MITEALLEMHFHSSLVELFATFFGKKFLKFLKPSTQKECWVGFDQGWIHTELPLNEFFDELKDKIKTGSSTFDKLYLAYFFQFKTVEEITRNSKLKPNSYYTPYFRSELSVHPNKTTGISQHETLIRLSRIDKAAVNYACGMLFKPDEVFEKPDLEKLRFIPLSNAPSGWTTNERHFLTFQSINDPNPFWCSKPIQGFSLTINQILEQQILRLLTPQELNRLIASINSTVSESFEEEIYMPGRIQTYYPSSFTIIEFENNQG